MHLSSLPSTQPNFERQDRVIHEIIPNGENKIISQIDPFHPKNLAELIQISYIWDMIFNKFLPINEYLQMRATCKKLKGLIDNKPVWDSMYKLMGSPYELSKLTSFQATRKIYRFFIKSYCTSLRTFYLKNYDPDDFIDAQIKCDETRNLKYQSVLLISAYELMIYHRKQSLMVQQDDLTKAYKLNRSEQEFMWFPELNENEYEHIKSFKVKSEGSFLPRKCRFRILNEDIYKLSNLKELILSNCSIKYFSFNLENKQKLDFPHLELLDLSENPLKKISFNSLEKLKYLNLRNCAIKHFSFNLENIQKPDPQLKSLDLSGNPLKEISFTFNGLEKLKSLNLGNCRLKKISFYPNVPKKLKYLNLEKCPLKGIFGIDQLINLKQINVCGVARNFGINELHRLSKLHYISIDKVPCGFNRHYEDIIQKETQTSILILSDLLITNISPLVNISESSMNLHKNGFMGAIQTAFRENEDVGDRAKRYFSKYKLESKPKEKIDWQAPRMKKDSKSPSNKGGSNHSLSMGIQSAFDAQNCPNFLHSQEHFNKAPLRMPQNNFHPQFDQPVQFGVPQNPLKRSGEGDIRQEQNVKKPRLESPNECNPNSTEQKQESFFDFKIDIQYPDRFVEDCISQDLSEQTGVFKNFSKEPLDVFVETAENDSSVGSSEESPRDADMNL